MKIFPAAISSFVIWLGLMSLTPAMVHAQQHWSLAPFSNERPKPGSQGKAATSPIDEFVLERAKVKLPKVKGFAPPADKHEWLRRVSVALTGLPPSQAEIAAFLADNSPDAKERVVDRLLASPGFGEHFAVMWLDLARYADTHGYHTDAHRDMWLYRDWVVDAINRDMPIDQFFRKQIAGDLLPGSSLADKVATGFLRNHMINSEEGIIAEEFKQEYVADRVDNFATAMLGLTMQCARCHDHKYEPIKQREYYQLAAFFDRVPDKGVDGRYGNAAPTIDAPPREAQVPWQRLNQRYTDLQNQLAAIEKEHQAELDAAVAELITNLPASNEKSLLLNLEEANPSWRAVGEVYWARGLHGDAVSFSGKSGLQQTVSSELDLSKPWSLEVLVNVRRPESGNVVRLAGKGQQFALQLAENQPQLLWHDGSKLRVFQTEAALTTGWQAVLVLFRGKDLPVQLAIGGRKVEVAEVEATEEETRRWQAWWKDWSPKDDELEILLAGPSEVEDTFRGLMDDLLLIPAAVTVEEAKTLAELSRAERLFYSQSDSVRQDARNLVLAGITDQAKELLKAIADQQRSLEMARRDFVSTMVMADGPDAPSYLLERGDYRQRGEEVFAGTPDILPPLKQRDEQADRLDLANWLVEEAQPLVARVFVNHVWQSLWGQGLVSTSNDFGSRGEPPSHPALLDYLASEFVERGWDLKWLVRSIVLSDTYGQTAYVDSTRRLADPENVYLLRGPRRTLSAEALRDAALDASGLLDPQLAGPPVKPYQPAGLWEEIAYDPRHFSAQVFEQSAGGDLARRSLYTFIKRTSPPPPMAIFNAPNRTLSCTRRGRANTPQQSLVLMNETGRVEAAKFLASSLLSQPYSILTPELQDRRRLADGFARVASRPASSEELDILCKLLDKYRSHYAADPAAAAKLLNVGDIAGSGVFPLDEHAAMTMVCNVLMSMDAATTY